MIAPPHVASIASTYEEVVVDAGNQPLLFMLVAFGVTFGVTRFITHAIRSGRYSWLGNVEAGDTHIHHLVWGIALLLISGVLAIAVQPPLEVTAVTFGIGSALTLDEFALWLHLEDVYWSEKGRQSIDAVILFVIVSGLMLIGAYPLSIGTSGSVGDIIELLVLQTLGLSFVVICALKGKLVWAVFGVYLWPVGLTGAWRIAKPDSWWARNRYEAAKLARANERYGDEAEVHKPDSV